MNSFRKDIVTYYLFSFLVGFYIANGTTVLFAQRLGFSYSRIFVLSAVYMLMFILFEIPTGALADLVGRKKTVVLGCFSLALAALATGVSSTFPQVFFSFFIWAFGFSLISGAMEAMLYDKLADKQVFNSVFGKSYFYFLLGSAAAGVLGPYLFSLNFRFPYLFSAFPFLLGGLVLTRFREETRASGQFTLARHVQQIQEGIKLTRGNKFVLWVMALMALRFATAYTFSNAFQPYLVNLGFSVKTFSLILPVMFVIEGLGGGAVGRMTKVLGERKVFVIGMLGLGVGLMLLGAFSAKALLLVLWGYMFTQGFLAPALSSYANEHIISSHRATIISVLSMTSTALAALMLFGFGALTDRIGVNNLLLVLGAGVLIAGGILLGMQPKPPLHLPLEKGEKSRENPLEGEKAEG